MEVPTSNASADPGGLPRGDPVNTLTAPVERLVQRFQIWRYEEQDAARSRSQRDAAERLQIARSSHLH
jgi:hypothetical protein